MHSDPGESCLFPEIVGGLVFGNRRTALGDMIKIRVSAIREVDLLSVGPFYEPIQIDTSTECRCKPKLSLSFTRA